MSKEAIEERIALAIVTAECVFGQAKVRLHAGYTAADNKAVIDVSSDVGEHIAQVFTGLMIKHLGEESFTIERLPLKEKSEHAKD
jgi:selenophosphate synthase